MLRQHLRHYLYDVGGLGLATFIRNWMRTLRYQCAYYDPTVDPVHPQYSTPAIYIFWHEYIPFMFYLRGFCRVSMLVSQHKDAELLARAANIMGFDLVRGSSKRGGMKALRELMRKGEIMNLTLTPDGPRGPRRVLAPGCLYLAAKLGMPIVPLGLAYQEPWRNRRAWDHFAIPKPFSNARAIFGPAIHLPANLDRDQIEQWRLRIESTLNQLTDAAEQWATQAHSLENSRPAFRQSIPLSIHRQAQYDQYLDQHLHPLQLRSPTGYRAA